MTDLMLESGEVHWLPTIMVVIIIGICWVLYIICYGSQSTSAGHIVEVDIWRELS